jgi:peptide/nickel transport system permease protein
VESAVILANGGHDYSATHRNFKFRSLRPNLDGNDSSIAAKLVIRTTIFCYYCDSFLLGWTTLGVKSVENSCPFGKKIMFLAAELIGCSKFRIIANHMVPTFLSHIIATGTLMIPQMIVNETSLSFLGLGLRPPAISYGVMLQEAQNVKTMAQAPWLMIPGLVVVIAVLMFNLAGDGLRDAADPYSK